MRVCIRVRLFVCARERAFASRVRASAYVRQHVCMHVVQSSNTGAIEPRLVQNFLQKPLMSGSRLEIAAAV